MTYVMDSDGKATEPRATIGASGAGLGGVIGSAVVWALGAYVFSGGRLADAGHVQEAIAAVPFPISALLVIVVPGIVGLVAARLAPGTYRADLAPSFPDPDTDAPDTSSELAVPARQVRFPSGEPVGESVGEPDYRMPARTDPPVDVV